MTLDVRYPAISDLRARARRRIPHFMWEYLDSGTGEEYGDRRNREALQKILFMPRVLEGDVKADLSVSMMGRTYPLPFGMAPVGMSGGMWPGAEKSLARAAVRHGIPYAMSTMAAQGPEDVEPGDQGWFQLYPPGEPEIRADMLKRIRDAGFHTLILTVDVPATSRRERQSRGGLTTPPSITLRTLWHIAQCPAWAMGILREGMPKLRFIGKYSENKGPLPSTAHIGYLLRIAPDWSYVKLLRDEWDGPFVVKGILRPEDAVRCREEGVDAVWVSNHAARQFDAVPAAIDCLPAVRAALGPDYPVLFDSGISGGLDIMRAIALGADFCFLGKAWHYALAALGERGPDQLVHILESDLRGNMGQLAAARLSDVKDCLIS